jgi:hypothetical protein
MHIAVFAIALLSAVSPCPTGTSAAMTCRSSTKTVAICVDTAVPARFAEYRLGPPALVGKRPDVHVTTERAPGRPFTFERRGAKSTLTLRTGTTTYEVYTDGGRGGVVVSGKGTGATRITCTNAVEEHWETLGTLGASSPSSAPLDPTMGKTMNDICNDPALMLTRYAWDDLSSGGHAARCCVDGALGAFEGCGELDWPSSDVPDCAFFDELRNEIFARYGYTFTDPRWRSHFAATPWYRPRADFDAALLPPVARANVATLKAMVSPTARSCQR